MGMVLKENAEDAEGVSEGGLEAKEKPEPKGADPPRENAEGAEVEQVVGIEKVKPDEDDDTGAGGTMLKGAAVEVAATVGGLGAATEVRPRFERAAGLGSLSPSKDKAVGGETSCLTPGLRLSRANGQSNPSVDSISIVGAGGKVFSSVMWISCWLV